MNRLATLIAAALVLAAGTAEATTLHLVRVVIVTRHGVRPPTQSNADLAKYADKAWPDWPVAPGELTPHGAETVRLMGVTLREAYRAAGLLPREGCAGPGQVTVWGDGADQRTRESGKTSDMVIVQEGEQTVRTYQKHDRDDHCRTQKKGRGGQLWS